MELEAAHALLDEFARLADGDEREPEEAVRVRAAERRLRGALRIDVDEVMVTRELGEGVDLRLRHLAPRREAEVLPRKSGEPGEIGARPLLLCVRHLSPVVGSGVDARRGPDLYQVS